ncbi:hypothetical protein SAMN04488128_1011411 [Chitinophaga eiseniae]|uniref:Uncharacterized protein n=1 Tax=Chitinophaga eiseniae TaxID=634771 RepID=A0A1T4N4E9_9BACT|nr:hypothetical protein [Chitinophaga eiseniae]SJZ73875.1 hypothetical protein SAMN04488128_1011411 [Chitinophaga eiseniae]
MTKDRLIKRLTWYYPAELSGAITFSGCFLLVLIVFPFRDTLFLLYGLAVFSFVLWQGQYYWKLKLRGLKGTAIDQQKSLALFRNAKQINLVLIAFIPVVLLVQIRLSGGDIQLLGYAIAANVMGILEHVNYYIRQLMIDNEYDLRYLLRYKRLKIPSLVKDLRDGRI